MVSGDFAGHWCVGPVSGLDGTMSAIALIGANHLACSENLKQRGGKVGLLADDHVSQHGIPVVFVTPDNYRRVCRRWRFTGMWIAGDLFDEARDVVEAVEARI